MKKQAWTKSDAEDVTLRHVAALAGVSRQAAGAILGERAHLFRGETQERVRSAAKQIGYRPNAAARAILMRQTKQIGVLIRNNAKYTNIFPHTYYTILGINMALEAAGYVLCLVRIGDVEREMTGGSRVFRERVLDGIIVTTTIPQQMCDAVEELVPNCIWVDTNIWRPTHCVRRDEFQAGQTAAQAAISRGYKKALWVTDIVDPETAHFSHVLRGEGVTKTFDAAAVEYSLVKTDWQWRPELINEFVPFMRPDVVIVVSDVERARLVAKAAMASRMVPGEDFGLVCCESVPDIAHGFPDLARVDFDRFELGRVAGEMMLDLLRPSKSIEEESDGETLQSVMLADVWTDGATLSARG